MKKNIVYTCLPILMVCMLMLLPSIIHAQPPSLGGDDVDDVPIDGGLSLMFAAGIGYGIKKIRKTK